MLQRKERDWISLGLRLFLTYGSFSRGTERRFSSAYVLDNVQEMLFSFLRGTILYSSQTDHQ